MFFEQIVIATGNRGKYDEFSRMIPSTFAGSVVFAPELSKSVDVDETGTTYADNALLKARAWAEISGLPCLADDSGIEAAALDGAPGVHSARIVPGTDEDRNNWLLEQLKGAEDRRGRFVAALALCVPSPNDEQCWGRGRKQWSLVCEGECRGRIAEAPSGNGGFGYDPLFFPDGFEGSFADIPMDVKNEISHRADALRGILNILAVK